MNKESSTLASAVEIYYDELKAFLIRKVGCPSTADEILHETWMRAVTRVPKNPIKHPRAFLYRIANNLLIDRIRKERRDSRVIVPGNLPESAPAKEAPLDSGLIGRERLSALQQAINELPPKCKQAFTMRKIELLDQEEIAKRLGISRNMVEKHLRKALYHCMKRMNELE